MKRRGERQYVAKTRNERRDERRDGAKRKVSEGSCLRLALVAAACRSCLRLAIVAMGDDGNRRLRFPVRFFEELN